MTLGRLCAAALLVVGLGTSAGCERTLAPPTSPTTVATTVSVFTTPQPAPRVTGKAVNISLSFVEFQYSPGTRWFYAPQIHIEAGSESSATTLTSFSFSIPGLGPSGRYCSAVPLPPGTAFDLFHEIYGDYEFTIDDPGYRATESSGSASIGLRDSTGAETIVEMKGPIVPGHLPTTYTGGTSSGWEFCR